MKTKIKIKSVFGPVLFELEKENNSVKDTLIEAVNNGAYLGDAYLRGADLRDAYLGGADLRGANLGDADLRDADLGDADLRDAKNMPFIPTYLPDGEFIAWKKLSGLIVKLKILEDSKRRYRDWEKIGRAHV